jgi:hypothetical protein
MEIINNRAAAMLYFHIKLFVIEADVVSPRLILASSCLNQGTKIQ